MTAPISARASIWAQVAHVQRGLAHHDDQRPTLLQRDVPRARDQGVGVGVGQRGERLDAALGDHHARRVEGAARQGCSDVPVVVDPGGQRLDIAHGVVGFVHERALGCPADDQMGLEPGDIPQHLEEPDPVDRPARSRHAHHETQPGTALGRAARNDAAGRGPHADGLARRGTPPVSARPPAGEKAERVSESLVMRLCTSAGTLRGIGARRARPWGGRRVDLDYHDGLVAGTIGPCGASPS